MAKLLMAHCGLIQFRLLTALVLVAMIAVLLATFRHPPIVAAHVLTYATVLMFVAATLGVVCRSGRDRMVSIGVAIGIGASSLLRLGGDTCFPDGGRLIETVAPQLKPRHATPFSPNDFFREGHHQNVAKHPDYIALQVVVASINTIFIGLMGGVLGFLFTVPHKGSGARSNN
jgi:hypothetical protein